MEEPLLLAIMTRVSVDKRFGTTAITKKDVDNHYLTWFKRVLGRAGLWKTEEKSIIPGATRREPAS